jgi:hypothetical protein
MVKVQPITEAVCACHAAQLVFGADQNQFRIPITL